MTKIAPSLLSFNFTNIEYELNEVNKYADYLHFDVMDGHFVPNLSFGPKILKDLKAKSNLFMDVHLMVSDPKFFSEVFINHGADLITFHFEALNDLEKCADLIKEIKEKGVKVGLSIKPMTSPETIKDLLKDLDLVLVMSVEPGFGGQAFLDSAYDKVKYLKEYKTANNLNYEIEVDGGVCDKNAKALVECGADVLVSGSYIMKGDIKANIDSMRF